MASWGWVYESHVIYSRLFRPLPIWPSSLFVGLDSICTCRRILGLRYAHLWHRGVNDSVAGVMLRIRLALQLWGGGGELGDLPRHRS